MENGNHFLYPAAIFFSEKPYLIHTILGSCVSLCLYDPVLRIGGMNHFMLPLWNGQGLASPRYGNIAIEKLVEKLLVTGSHKFNLKAKIFGGAEVISTNASQFHIGKRNVQIARQLLEEQSIPIISSSTGGKLGRKIIFHTQTGEVIQRFIGKES
jgi:chemotaxis protein CheD